MLSSEDRTTGLPACTILNFIRVVCDSYFVCHQKILGAVSFGFLLCFPALNRSRSSLRSFFSRQKALAYRLHLCSLVDAYKSVNVRRQPLMILYPIFGRQVSGLSAWDKENEKKKQKKANSLKCCVQIELKVILYVQCNRKM